MTEFKFLNSNRVLSPAVSLDGRGDVASRFIKSLLGLRGYGALSSRVWVAEYEDSCN